MGEIKTKIGAVLFNQEHNISAKDRTIISLDDAWFSISGEPAKKVQSIHDLPNDTIWLTNLTFNQFTAAGLNKHANFRNDGWLRSGVHQLTSELGLTVDNASQSVAASAIAAIAQRVINIAHEKIGVKPTLLDSFNKDVANAIGPAKSLIPDQFYKSFEQCANHYWVKVINHQNYTAKNASFTARVNRLSHAKALLGTQLPPDTGWEFQKSSGKVKLDTWLSTIDKPFLANCIITNVQPMIGEILSWGSGAQAKRDWLTNLELDQLREYADIEIESALVCSNDPISPIQADLLPSSPLDELSMSLGIFAELLWTSLTNKQPQTREGRFSAAAAWLRAADRMIMFNFAQRAVARGLDVAGYGAGAITIRYPEGGLKKALGTATDIGLIPPASKFIEARQLEGPEGYG